MNALFAFLLRFKKAPRTVPITELDFARSVAKRLDEHRELAQSIEKHTDLFSQCPWHIGHMATQDDYLMKLFYLRHGEFPAINTPTDLLGFVRPRPLILGVCRLPEYIESHSQQTENFLAKQDKQ
ncbi:hypothetical protein [Photobacterium indicum]|uniref:hypothetical protein n=1 Tax=Photobacterium indicum TaxID=81447 RepID=UPI003D0D9F3E